MNLLKGKGLVFRSRFHATTYYVCFLYVFTTSVCHDGEGEEAVAPENDTGTRKLRFRHLDVHDQETKPSTASRPRKISRHRRTHLGPHIRRRG